VLLSDGSKYYFEPQAQPDFPVTLRAKRLDSGEE
jgi:nitrogen fixation protein NifT